MTRKPTVLVVDDDPAIRKMIAEVLSLEGYTMATAANGKEALDVLAAYPGHYLILTGLVMPVMDGVEFVRRLEAMPEERAKHRILVVSAMLRRLPWDVRVEGRLPKPFTTDQLISSIEAIYAV